MANKITVTDLVATTFVTPTSRYKGSSVLYYGDSNLLTFETYKKGPILQTEGDRYAVITKGTEFRPDLVSQTVYGFPDFWWRILEANNMKDIYEFKAGVNIRIPNTIF